MSSLRQHGLEQLPEDLDQLMPQLTELLLADNNLTAVNLSACSHLQLVDLTNNDLCSVSKMRLPSSLQQVRVAGNPNLEAWAHQLLAVAYPSLQRIDSHAAAALREPLRKVLAAAREAAAAQVSDQTSSRQRRTSGQRGAAHPTPCGEVPDTLERTLQLAWSSALLELGPDVTTLPTEFIQRSMYGDAAVKATPPMVSRKRSAAQVALTPSKKPKHLNFHFELKHLLRAHGHQTLGVNDAKAQVWSCGFASCNDAAVSGIVATAGGEVICFIDVALGEVLQKYTHPHEVFYALSWSQPQDAGGQGRYIVAAGGKQRDIKLLDYEQSICYAQLTGAHDNVITALAFAHSMPHGLLSSDDAGCVVLWDICKRCQLAVCDLAQSHGSSAQSLCAVPCSHAVLVGLDNGTILRLTWQARQRKNKDKAKGASANLTVALDSAAIHRTTVDAIAQAPSMGHFGALERTKGSD